MENIDDSEMDSYDKEVNMYLNEHNNENQDNELENYGTIKEDVSNDIVLINKLFNTELLARRKLLGNEIRENKV